MNAEHASSCRIILPPPPLMQNADRCLTPESEASSAFDSLDSAIPFLLPPLAPSASKHGKKQQLPSLSTQLSCPLQLGLGLLMPEAADSKARLTRRMQKRKSAEKARRDALKETLDQVRALLPSNGKRLSKEALVERAHEYIVELHKQASEKANQALGLEAEILALKRSIDI
ncbi:hypothetical protein BC830DRAFT_1166825 [Chytriomyces sp. MP71]|nr:hypothetical protein BC830DRAFT_1166825 [Chytriomyces sp. MP71]